MLDHTTVGPAISSVGTHGAHYGGNPRRFVRWRSGVLDIVNTPEVLEGVEAPSPVCLDEGVAGYRAENFTRCFSRVPSAKVVAVLGRLGCMFRSLERISAQIQESRAAERVLLVGDAEPGIGLGAGRATRALIIHAGGVHCRDRPWDTALSREMAKIAVHGLTRRSKNV